MKNRAFTLIGALVTMALGVAAIGFVIYVSRTMIRKAHTIAVNRERTYETNGFIVAESAWTYEEVIAEPGQQMEMTVEEVAQWACTLQQWRVSFSLDLNGPWEEFEIVAGTSNAVRATLHDFSHAASLSGTPAGWFKMEPIQ